MAAHGVVAPGSEVFFHPAAGSTDAGGLQYCLADLKRLMFEGKEVDSGNDQVAPDPSGIDFWFAEDVGNHLQVFLLNQGDLTFSGNTSAETVSIQPGTLLNPDGFQCGESLLLSGTDPNLFQFSGLRNQVQKFLDHRFVVGHRILRRFEDFMFGLRYCG